MWAVWCGAAGAAGGAGCPVLTGRLRAGRTFCLRHRHEADHGCEGEAARRSDAAKRREATQQVRAPAQRRPAPSSLAAGLGRELHAARGARSQLQAGLSDEEALRAALAASAAESGGTAPAGEGDLELAMAMSASMAEEQKKADAGCFVA